MVSRYRSFYRLHSRPRHGKRKNTCYTKVNSQLSPTETLICFTNNITPKIMQMQLITLKRNVITLTSNTIVTACNVNRVTPNVWNGKYSSLHCQKIINYPIRSEKNTFSSVLNYIEKSNSLFGSCLIYQTSFQLLLITALGPGLEIRQISSRSCKECSLRLYFSFIICGTSDDVITTSGFFKSNGRLVTKESESMRKETILGTFGV